MLSIEELRNLALLARIDVPDAELEGLRGQLDEILGFVAQVQGADTSSLADIGVTDASTLPKLRNVFRDDGEPHETGRYSESIIGNFPSSINGSLKVKKILEK